MIFQNFYILLTVLRVSSNFESRINHHYYTFRDMTKEEKLIYKMLNFFHLHVKMTKLQNAIALRRKIKKAWLRYEMTFTLSVERVFGNFFCVTLIQRAVRRNTQRTQKIHFSKDNFQACGRAEGEVMEKKVFFSLESNVMLTPQHPQIFDLGPCFDTNQLQKFKKRARIRNFIRLGYMLSNLN